MRSSCQCDELRLNEWGDSAATLKIPISHRLLDGGHPSAHFNFSMCKARVNKRMCKKRMNE